LSKSTLKFLINTKNTTTQQFREYYCQVTKSSDVLKCEQVVDYIIYSSSFSYSKYILRVLIASLISNKVFQCSFLLFCLFYLFLFLFCFVWIFIFFYFCCSSKFLYWPLTDATVSPFKIKVNAFCYIGPKVARLISSKVH
jgi:hypothetical protein